MNGFLKTTQFYNNLASLYTTTTLADIKKNFLLFAYRKKEKKESTKNTLNSVSNKRTKDLKNSCKL